MLIRASSLSPPAGAIGLIAGGAGVLVGGIGALLTAKTINDGGSYDASDYQAMVSRGQALNGAAIALDDRPVIYALCDAHPHNDATVAAIEPALCQQRMPERR